MPKPKEERRCPMCDEWYDPTTPEAKVHDHPEPQSGPPREDWIKSRMPYERWITITYEGMVWDRSRNFKGGEMDGGPSADWYDSLKTLQEKVQNKVEVEFGALAPKLSKQIPGIPLEFDNDADAITRLYVRGLLTDTETKSARMRLLKKIKGNAK